MFNKLLSKYIPVIATVVIFGLGIILTYYIISSTTTLAEKGWKPAVTYIAIILLFICFGLILLRKQLSSKIPQKKEVVDKTTQRRAEKEELQKKMTAHNAKEESSKLDKNLIVSAFGVTRAGKSSIIKELIELNDNESQKQVFIDLQEAPPITVNDSKNNQIIEKYNDCRLALFVITEDLTSYEWDVLYKLIDIGLYVIIILNKIDLLTTTQVEGIEQSINQKIQQMQDYQRCSFTQATASPKPMTVIIQDVDGNEKEEERTLPSDCKSLFHHIQKYISKHSSNSSIKFLKTNR